MSNRIIKINRGDPFKFKVFIPNNSDTAENYFLTANDTVYFALLYPNQPFENAIFIKGFDKTDQIITADSEDAGSIEIHLTSLETKYLQPGVYYYTVKLKQGGNPQIPVVLTNTEVMSTIITRTKFIVNE